MKDLSTNDAYHKNEIRCTYPCGVCANYVLVCDASYRVSECQHKEQEYPTEKQSHKDEGYPVEITVTRHVWDNR